MVVPILTSSLVAGIVATSLMLPLFHLPRLAARPAFDVIGALGSAATGRDDGTARPVGALLFYLGGVAFAVLYGLLAATLLTAEAPQGGADLLPVGSPEALPVLGLVLGLAHGGIVALLLTIVVVEHHPFARYRQGFGLVVPALLAHPLFGVAVMLVHGAVLGRWLPS